MFTSSNLLPLEGEAHVRVIYELQLKSLNAMWLMWLDIEDMKQ